MSSQMVSNREVRSLLVSGGAFAEGGLVLVPVTLPLRCSLWSLTNGSGKGEAVDLESNQLHGGDNREKVAYWYYSVVGISRWDR